MLKRLLSIAPMMGWTDKHCRYFLRLFSPHVLLYTEMITSNAILHGNWQSLLAYDPTEHPVALQLGGSDPNDLAQCAQIAEDCGYDEINLNVGCPSDRVQTGRFGACLMAEPELVGICVAAMKAKTSLPVTVKTRIGIDQRDSYDELCHFINTVAAHGCHTFIIHARKAWLKGLSPKENREIPPLKYDMVYQIKQDFPSLEIIINGGIMDVTQIKHHLRYVDGVMIGRAAYHNPFLLAEASAELYQSDSTIERRVIIEHFLPYVEKQLAKGTALSQMTRHILGVFQGMPGARAWRRYLSENVSRRGANIEIIKQALSFL